MPVYAAPIEKELVRIIKVLLWPYPESHFDLVHLRLMICSIDN